MTELPRDTLLGVLRLEHVIEYYDFPRLFTCINNTGQSYFALSIFDDDKQFDWLYLPVSPSRKEALLRGRLALQQAFTLPEGGYLFKVVTYSERVPPEVVYLLPEQVSQEDLPSASYLAAIDGSLGDQTERPTAQVVASATRRETFDYRIFPGHPNIHEIPARKLGGVLTSTQELIDALAQAALGDATVRGPLPAELLLKTRLDVTHSFNGSFGVQFSAAQISDLLDDSVVAKALRQLANLMSAEDSEDLLSNKLHQLKGRVTSKYRRLLKELSDLNSGLFFEWGSVNPEAGGIFELSSDQIRSAYAIVDRIEIAMSDEISIKGKLIGFNSRTRRYEILSSDDGKSYSGKLADDVRLDVPNPAIGEFYEVDLRMLIETQSSSGDELVRWILIRLGALT